MKTNTAQAFTLIELLISISIIAILTNLALPSFEGFLERRKIEANQQRLIQVLQLSRVSAATKNIRVTICASDSGTNCSSDWSEGFIAFTDIDGNRVFNGNDELLYQYHNNDRKVIISWRAFGHKKSLQWLPTGITNHQNGSFELCYDDKEKLARALFITKAGRVRFSKDTNADQLHENSTGGKITC